MLIDTDKTKRINCLTNLIRLKKPALYSFSGQVINVRYKSVLQR